MTLADVTLCEEAVFQSLSSLRLSSVPLEKLLESLPGQKVDHKSLERLKKTCSPQQQVLHLLRLWRQQNKDKLFGIIQGIDQKHKWITVYFFYLLVLKLLLCISRDKQLREENHPQQHAGKPHH